MANPFYPPKSARDALGSNERGDLGSYPLDQSDYQQQQQRQYFDPHRQNAYQQQRRTEYNDDGADLQVIDPQSHYAALRGATTEYDDPYATPLYPPYSGKDDGGLRPPNALGGYNSYGPPTSPRDETPSRPGTPGIYPDRPPKLERLTPAQRKIADSFPKDLDKNGGTMWADMVAIAKDWRSYVKWRYTHWYVGLIIAIVLVALMSIYHKQIVDWLTPMSLKVKELHW